MTGVEKELLSHLFRDLSCFELSKLKELHRQCVALAKEVCFFEVEEDDVVKLLESHEE
jgi:hypothetical protein